MERKADNKILELHSVVLVSLQNISVHFPDLYHQNIIEKHHRKKRLKTVPSLVTKRGNMVYVSKRYL